MFYYDDGSSGGRLLVAMDQPDGQRSGVSDIREDGDGLFHVRVTLDYLWFTHVGYPPTIGNRVDVIADGDAGWAAVAEAMQKAQRTLHVTTWIYQPTSELLRPNPLTDPAEREGNTIQSMLEQAAARGILVRLLLWDAPFIDVPREARRAGRRPGDNLEVMQEANPTRRPLLDASEWPLYNRLLGNFQIGSYHQKTVVADGEVGFCTGMNLRENDWDTSTHALFDPHRCRFVRPSWFRREVLDRLHFADHGPRHDFIARLEGPAVKHLEENFRERWNRLIESRARFAENATPLPASAPDAPVVSPRLFPNGAIEVKAPVSSAPDGPPALSTESATPVAPPEHTGDRAPPGASQVQVIRTMPAPTSERGILDVFMRAIGAARQLIYIESQYFRSIHVSDALADAVKAHPDLHVIVVTVQGHADNLVTGSWARECFERVKRRKPDFELYALKVGAEYAGGALALEEVDNHAKLMIVDDMFLTVGSCNMNDRGFEFEGELNLAVVDPALVKGVRVALFRGHLGDDRVSGDIDADAALWREHAEKNRSYDATSGIPPASYVFPFEPRAKRRIIFGHSVF